MNTRGEKCRYSISIVKNRYKSLFFLADLELNRIRNFEPLVITDLLRKECSVDYSMEIKK
jgi:hypothetical protein